MPDEVNLLWVHLRILRTHLSTSHRKCGSHPKKCLREERKDEGIESLFRVSRQPGPSGWITKWWPPTRRRSSLTWPVAAYSLVPLTSELGCANKNRRGSLAFFSIHACFENITCLADYMIIILKGCQGASGIIIIWFAGFRAHGNTLVLGCLL